MPSRQIKPIFSCGGPIKNRKSVLRKAIAEAYEAGLPWVKISWDRVMISIFILHTSAGRYICGEETGLLNSLEGKKGHTKG
jgi:NADH-quinone oxidoreductase subunit F